MFYQFHVKQASKKLFHGKYIVNIDFEEEKIN